MGQRLRELVGLWVMDKTAGRCTLVSSPCNSYPAPVELKFLLSLYPNVDFIEDTFLMYITGNTENQKSHFIIQFAWAVWQSINVWLNYDLI